MTDLTTPRALDGPDRVPEPRGPLEPSPAGSPVTVTGLAPTPGLAPPGGVALTRLLALARPTPSQALELGLGLLDALLAAAADGTAPEAVDPVVTGDGRVAPLAGPAGARGRPADRVLAELAAA